MSFPIAYQLYSSRNFPPLDATMKMLAGLGYTAVEGFGGFRGGAGMSTGLPMAFPLDGLPSRVRIHEVGARDGLQNEDTVPVSQRVRLIDALSATGLRFIEAASFVRDFAIDNPHEVGADRIVNSVAAFRRFGGPCIVVATGNSGSRRKTDGDRSR